MAARRDNSGSKTVRQSPRGRAAGRSPGLAAGSRYWFASSRPLHILAFLAPLIVLYEIGSARYLNHEGARQSILAAKLLGDFFELFGAVGLFLPGVALVTVLLVWHILTGDQWRIRPAVPAGMLAESVAWTLPLLVLGVVHSRAAERLAQAALAGASDLAALPWQARLTISIGAGLYEEMLFRMVLIALLHLLLADMLRIRNGTAATLAVLGGAVAFAFYHNTTLATGGLDWPKLIFLTAAGAYLGTLYIVRGFGIAAGTHAVYDVLVLVLLSPASAR